MLVCLGWGIRTAVKNLSCRYSVWMWWRRLMPVHSVVWAHQTDVILPTTSHIILNPLQPITKTRLYNFDPLKPHFYIIKLGFTGVYIIFLILLKNRLWVLVRTASAYPQSMFWAEIWKKYQIFLSENFPVFGVKFSIYLNRRVLVMQSVWRQAFYQLSHSDRLYREIFWSRVQSYPYAHADINIGCYICVKSLVHISQL